MTTKEFCKKYNLTIDQFYGKEKINGDLNLSSVTSIPKGFNPTVSGNLDFHSLTSIPKGFNPTVGGNLDLNFLMSIPKGFNPTVGGDLWLNSLTSIPKGFNPTVGGDLWLDSLTSIPKGFNPTVGWNLNLSSLTSIPEGFNPIVGCNLWLDSLTSIPKGFNPTVGGILWLDNNEPVIHKGAHKQLPAGYVFRWENDGKKYIKADWIFSEIISHHGNVYHIKSIGFNKITYLVTNGNGKWSHGDTLKKAREDLIYKIKNRDTSAYKDYKLDTKISFEKGIECYRAITGACAEGTKQFVQMHNIDKKRNYTIKEIIKMTVNQFGHKEFQAFFS